VIEVSCLSAHDPQLARLADAIAQRVGPQRFHVWFNNSTRLDLKHDGLEIAVPNDFISEWIGTHFKTPIQEAAHEVLGCPLPVRFSVVPQLFEVKGGGGDAKVTVNGVAASRKNAVAIPANGNGRTSAVAPVAGSSSAAVVASNVVPIMRSIPGTSLSGDGQGSVNYSTRSRLRHDVGTYVVGPSNQLAYNAASTSPSSRARSTTRCSSTATAAWAKRTCSRGCAGNSSSSTRPSAGCI
jgi:chromosomal replication initiation ATPase DnaA